MGGVVCSDKFFAVADRRLTLSMATAEGSLLARKVAVTYFLL